MKTPVPLVQFNYTSAERPYRLLQKWYDKAQASGMAAPNGMTLASATPDGRPSARIVLLKQVIDEGLVFFTNYSSRKGRELEANPHAALVMWWPDLNRQIRVTGPVVHTSDEVSDAYFNSRPRSYRLGAWASKQSEAMADRLSLAKAFVKVRERYKRQEVPRPPHWGGYLLQPEAFEFWEERVNRLHERQQFLKDGNGWTLRRLYP